VSQGYSALSLPTLFWIILYGANLMRYHLLNLDTTVVVCSVRVVLLNQGKIHRTSHGVGLHRLVREEPNSDKFQAISGAITT
jgi:hypothetical protein